MVGCLVGWLVVAGFVGWLAGWRVGWLVRWQDVWMDGRTDRQPDRRTDGPERHYNIILIMINSCRYEGCTTSPGGFLAVWITKGDNRSNKTNGFVEGT